MDNKHHDDEIQLPVRFPGALSLKDLITIVSVAISLTIAWGVFGTRLTLIEKELASHSVADDKVARKVEEIDKRTTTVEQQQHDDAFLIDQLYDYAGKPTPKRRAPY